MFYTSQSGHWMDSIRDELLSLFSVLINFEVFKIFFLTQSRSLLNLILSTPLLEFWYCHWGTLLQWFKIVNLHYQFKWCTGKGRVSSLEEHPNGWIQRKPRTWNSSSIFLLTCDWNTFMKVIFLGGNIELPPLQMNPGCKQVFLAGIFTGMYLLHLPEISTSPVFFWVSQCPFSFLSPMTKLFQSVYTVGRNWSLLSSPTARGTMHFCLFQDMFNISIYLLCHSIFIETQYL